MSYADLQRRLQIRPIERWPGDLTPDDWRRQSPFKADWRSTRTLLDHELEAHGAEAVVLQVAYSESDMRLDGFPYARAQALHPGVILSFNRDGNPAERVEFATDRFDRWQDNLRAIALSLEALRKVDRYGVTSGGQQYAGFKALPRGDDGKMGLYTAAEAQAWLEDRYGGDIRAALRDTHPDSNPGADPDDYRRVIRVKELVAG